MKISIGYRADSRLLCVLPVLQSRMVHSEKLSKSKPFGILRFGQFCITLPPMDARIIGSRRSPPMFARLIQLGLAFLFASVLTAGSPAFAGDDSIVTVKSAYPGDTLNV
jgi:hypothetical protein